LLENLDQLFQVVILKNTRYCWEKDNEGNWFLQEESVDEQKNRID
jgi:hypothetical protein